MNLPEIESQARKELKMEQDREKIEEIKAKLRGKKSLWHKIFPFKIRIERR